MDYEMNVKCVPKCDHFSQYIAKTYIYGCIHGIGTIIRIMMIRQDVGIRRYENIYIK